MKRLTLLTLPILALASLTSCGGDDPLTYKKGDRIYQEKIFFDTSDSKAGNASIYLGVDGKVKTVKLGRNEIKCGYRNQILTFAPKDLRAVGAGEKPRTLHLTMVKKYLLISLTLLNSLRPLKTSKILALLRKHVKATMS